MSQAVAEGRVHHERHDHILKIVIDNPAKKNAFVPEMMAATRRRHDASSTAIRTSGSASSAPRATTSPPAWTCRSSSVPAPRQAEIPDDHIDPFGMRNQCRKPVVTAVQGICFTVGIEMVLAGDIVVAAEGSRFCQMEAKRGIAPLGGAHFRFITPRRLGRTRCTTCCCATSSAPPRPTASASSRKSSPPVSRSSARWRSAAHHRRQRPARHPGHQGSRPQVHRGRRARRHRLRPEIRDRVMKSADAAEGIRSFVERRAAVFKGR